MPLTVPVAHDFICPWCWVGFLQARRLQHEFGIRIDWRGYELYPDALEWPEPTPPKPPNNRPRTPGRFALMLAAENLEMPKVSRPEHMRTHNAHEAVEFAREEGVEDRLVEVLYRAYWEQGLPINEPAVLVKLACGIVHDIAGMEDAIRERRFKDRIIGFDDDAYARGVFNVPTFFIGPDRLAEQPYGALRASVESHLAAETSRFIYRLDPLPKPLANRPYVWMNMVSTIDGKTVSGSRDEDVLDLGSKLDHKVMRRIEEASDAVLVGGQTLRVTSPNWNPATHLRVVVSNGGNLPADAAFLRNGAPIIATSGSAGIRSRPGTKLLRAGSRRVDFSVLLERLREMGVQRLLVLGGSEINAQLLEQDLVDELFLTIAPKIRLGRNLPTYAGGDPLPKGSLPKFSLVEHRSEGDELFIRYRRERSA